MTRWHHRSGAIKEPRKVAGGDHVVIIGPYGNVWHDGTFPDAEAAEHYLREYWGSTPFEPSQWRLACATVIIEAAEPSFPLPSQSPSGDSQ